MVWDDAKIRFQKALEPPKSPAGEQSFFNEKKDKGHVERASRGKQFLEHLCQFRDALEWIHQCDTEDDLWIALLNAATNSINHPAKDDRKQLVTCLDNIYQKYEFIISDEKKTRDEMLGTVILVVGSVAVVAFGLGIIGLMLASGPLGIVAIGGMVAGGIVALVGAGLIIASALQLHKQVEFHKGNQLQEIKDFVDYLAPPEIESDLSIQKQ